MRDGFNRLLLEDEELGNTDILEPIPDDEGEVEQVPANTAAVTTVDISTFGSDNSDVHNEYDPKEIERLNILIASENSAIGEYFTAAKETNIDVLRRLYSDIGEEERFHSEQLIFAKSQITGETYVPRDPDVKAEYEKLLDMGMDEETAMTTAVDKVGLMNRERTVTPEEEAQQREDLIEDMEVVEYSMYQEYLIFNMMTSPRIKDLYEHDSAIRNYCESYIDTAVELTPQIFVEAVVDSSSFPANKQKVLPDLLGSIARLIKNAIKAIKTMGQKFTQFWVNMRETRKHYASWLKNHSIKDIFAKGFSLYLWDDNKNDFDFDDPAAFIYLLNSATEKVANEFGISVKKPTPKFNMATNKTINASSIDEAIQIVKNAKFIPTKIVLNENNEQTILTKIFGITNAKLNNERDSADKSMNGYNSFEALVSDCNAYLENANAVLTQLNQLKGQQGGTVQSDPEKFNTAIKQMKDIANGYTKWINIINHDMTAMMKINNELAAQIKAGTEEADINSSVDKLQKNKEALQRELTRLEGEKAKNPNNSTVLKAITQTKNEIAKIDAQLNKATREPQTPPDGTSQDQTAPAETPEGQGAQATQTNDNPSMPEVGATNVPQTPVEQKPSSQQQPAPEQKPAQSSLKEDWKEYVKSASGSGMYVSIIKNKNNTYTIEHSTEKRESIFMAPDGIGRNYCNIFIAPNASVQSLRNDLISQYFDITGAGLNGTSIVSITPAAFDATNTKNVFTLNSKGIIETAQDKQPVQPQPQNQTQQPAAAPQAQPQAQQPAQPQAQQAPQAQQQPQSSKTTWDQLKTMASKGQQFIFKPAPDEYGGPWYLYKSNEPGNFFGFPAQSNPGDYQVYPNPGWFRPDNEPFREHYDDMDAAFEGVVKNGMGGAVTNIAPAIFAPDNSTKGQQQGRYKLLEKGIVEQEPDTSQK